MPDLKAEYDVVVVGGGTGGVPAAIAAARNGMSVLLIEKNGFLGGLTTGGLTIPVWPHWTGGRAGEGPREYFIKGIYTEIRDRLNELGALAPDERTADEEILKFVLQELCLEAGVQLLFHSFVFRLTKNGRRVTTIEIANKSGSRSFSARVFIDGTGDADLVALAGGQWLKGRDADGATQPMTMTFRLGGVDTDKLAQDSPYHHSRISARGQGPSEMPEGVASIHEEYLEAKNREEISDPRPILMYSHYFRPGIVHFNTTRVQYLDATNAEDLTRAEIAGKRQVIEILKFLKRFPAFADAYLIQMSSEIGIRETRRIVGDYVLTEEDVLSGRKFEDGIARGHAPVDIHDPDAQDMSTDVILKFLPRGTTYDIPYRCLVPKDFDNVLMGSRCLSATHEAHGSVRMIHHISAVGQAAGTAAALACRNDVPCHRIDVEGLRRTLAEQGASIWREGMPG
jgi:hypothetical protein